MRRGSLLSILLLALGLVFAAASVASAGEVEDHLARVAKLETARAKLDKERKASESVYQSKTVEIARLKSQPSSWNRDRKLESLLAESREMAASLDKRDRESRELGRQIDVEKKAAIAAIDRELKAQPAPAEARRGELEKKRTALAGARAPHKIKIGDERINPLDDPEDLEYKAQVLGEAEKQLRAEEQRLERRATYYHKQAKLTKSARRADEQDVFRDDRPRRGRGGNGAQDTDNGAPMEDGAAEPPPPAAGGDPSPGGVTDTDDGGFTGTPPLGPGRDESVGGADVSVDPAVVLADVASPETLDELRRAEKSGDPEAVARAAERARKEVVQRAERVRQRRLEMERRAKQLRDE